MNTHTDSNDINRASTTINTITVKAGYAEAARRVAGEILEERGFTNIKIGAAKATGSFDGLHPSLRLFKVEYLADQESQGGYPKVEPVPCPRCNGYGDGHECQVLREFDLDDDEPTPEPWANDQRVKGGLVR